MIYLNFFVFLNKEKTLLFIPSLTANPNIIQKNNSTWTYNIINNNIFQIRGCRERESEEKRKKERNWWRNERGTWKAEEAVPKTKAFGKLGLVIVRELHVWIWNAKTTIIIAILLAIAMPFLLNMVSCIYMEGDLLFLFLVGIFIFYLKFEVGF